jgi:osmotically inducible protein OsmC
MARHSANAEWTVELARGRGEVSIGGRRLGLAYARTRLPESAGTNPEELLAAAHAASLAIALEAAFLRAHRRVHRIRVRAELHLDHREDAWTITRSDLESEVASEPDRRSRDLFEAEFQRIVEEAAARCPVSRALAGVEITVDAEPASADTGADFSGADLSPTELRPTPPRAERWRAGRERRVLEGRVMSGIRAQSRRRRFSSAGASPVPTHPRLSRSAHSSRDS